MILHPDEIKLLVDRYPYLIPRNVWTGVVSQDYDYSYFVGNNLGGWERLFLLYCKTIRKPLADVNRLNTFMFTDVKEKYGSLRLYNVETSEAVIEITTQFEQMSKHICFQCGKIASYRTCGWVYPYCKSCIQRAKKCGETFTRIRRPNKVKIIHYSNNGTTKKLCKLRHLWREYEKCYTMTDKEFYTYLLT